MIKNKNKQSKYIIFTIIILIFFSSIKLKANEAFYAKDHIIHDLIELIHTLHFLIFDLPQEQLLVC